MSEGIVIALISAASAVICAGITVFGGIVVAGLKNNKGLSAGMIGLLIFCGAGAGLVVGALFGAMLMRQPSQSSSAVIQPPANVSSPDPISTPVGVSPNRLCPLIVIEGTVGGLPIAQTKTWSELATQGTTREPQSANLSEACSRDSDDEVQVWVGYWDGDPNYLDFRRTMTVDEAISLVRQNPNQPVIIVPWGE